jgi:hypothetical protein
LSGIALPIEQAGFPAEDGIADNKKYINRGYSLRLQA